MRRTFAVLSILFLFAASLASYAEYCVFSPKACLAMAEAAGRCPMHAEAASAVGSCCKRVASECQSSPACGGASCDLPVEACRAKQDCIPKICRLRPPLFADGPNRVKLHAPQTIEFTLVPLLFSCETASYSRMPFTPPPRAVHPSIAMTVLRI